jgi:hypothetical protein
VMNDEDLNTFFRQKFKNLHKKLFLVQVFNF